MVRKGIVSVPGRRFVDDGHLRYYVSCGGKKKDEKKKKAKLVKGLEKDLSALYSIGFGVEHEHGLTGEIQNKMFSVSYLKPYVLMLKISMQIHVVLYD